MVKFSVATRREDKYIPSSSSSSSAFCFPSTEFWEIAFSNSAFPYAKYRSAVSGASSPCFFVLSHRRWSEHQDALRDAQRTCYSHLFQRGRVVLHSLLVFLECKCAFGVCNSVFKRHGGLRRNRRSSGLL